MINFSFSRLVLPSHVKTEGLVTPNTKTNASVKTVLLENIVKEVIMSNISSVCNLTVMSCIALFSSSIVKIRVVNFPVYYLFCFFFLPAVVFLFICFA